MWLVFIIVVVFLILLRIGLFFSKIKVTINNINISENRFDINAKLALYIFYKFRILSVRVNEKGIKIGFIFVSYKKIFKKMDVEEFAKKTFKPMSIEKIKKLNILLEKFQIDCRFGTEDIFITVSVVTILSVIFSIVLEKELIKEEKLMRRKNKGKFEIEKYKYKIMPVFGRNVFKFKGDLSISFKTRRIGIFLSPKEHTKFKILVGG